MKNIYDILFRKYGKQNWWPCISNKKFEIVIGTILTQNTSWTNVEKAIVNLKRENLLDAKKIINVDVKKLANLIKPSGYYNQKAERLKIVSEFFLSNKNPSREELLNLKGVGKETADSILLYAYNKPYFVIDAYTKRIFNRLGFDLNDYDDFQELFHKNLEKDHRLYNEFHALILRLAKENCKVKPVCENCCLKKKCKFTS